MSPRNCCSKPSACPNRFLRRATPRSRVWSLTASLVRCWVQRTMTLNNCLSAPAHGASKRAITSSVCPVRPILSICCRLPILRYCCMPKDALSCSIHRALWRWWVHATPQHKASKIPNGLPKNWRRVVAKLFQVWHSALMPPHIEAR